MNNKRSRLGLWLLLVCSWLVPTAFASGEVRLKFAQFTPYAENGVDYAELEGAVEVKNLGPVKKVWLHYQGVDGQWRDHPAFYTASTENGFEAFTFRLPLQGAVSQVAFAIKYQVNGQTYWDNNSTQNYRFDANQQTAFLHQAVAVDDASKNYSNVTITARSRWQTETDSVTLVYSFDQWQTQSRRPLNLSHVTGDAFGNSALWSLSMPVEYYRGIDYYLEYTSGQQVFVDNYHGKGYRLMPYQDNFGYGGFKQRYPQLYFRGQPTSWKSLPMSLIGDYTWSILVYFDGSTDFKFDVYNDWSRNFGDNHQDGFVDLNGANMKVTTAGSILITVNTQTGEYKTESPY